MNLNLPITELLQGAKNVLVAGMGGGFDVYAGLPIYLELRRQGFTVHLASLSFAAVSESEGGYELTPDLVGVHAGMDNMLGYFPELWLSVWFRTARNEEVTVWSFEKCGGAAMRYAYQTLVDHLNIDAIIMVDGGVDSLMHGDEPLPGTLIEDTMTLTAVASLSDVPVRIIAAVGLGIEYEVSYNHLFENIAELTRAGAYLGSCALVKSMPVYQQYEAAVLSAFDLVPGSSMISSALVSAVRGEFGNYHLTDRSKGRTMRISALMPLYWFFDGMEVARRNHLIELVASDTTGSVMYIATQKGFRNLPRRPPVNGPLPGS